MGLGFFPPLGDDELLYSGLARLNRRIGDISALKFARLAFGSTRHPSAPALFQPNVEGLLKQLPPNSTWTAEEFLWQHMMTPYFSPFAQSESLQEALTKIQFGGAGASWNLGWRFTTSVSAGRLRCCAKCFEEDVDRIGEGTWRRVHQCPPALTCPDHDELLLETTVPIGCRNRVNGKWIPLSGQLVEQAAPVSASRPREIHFELARRCQWLLQASLPPQPRVEFSRRYKLLAEQGGWVGHAGRPDWTVIGREILELYGEWFLSRFSLEGADEPRRSWINELVTENSRGYAPIRHLLLITFFGPSMEQFFAGDLSGPNLRKADLEARSGPCKNVFCQRYDEHGVPEGLIGQTLVSCPDCEFSYRFASGGKFARRIVSLGDLWVERVLEMRGAGRKWVEVADLTHLPLGAIHELKTRFNRLLVREEIEARGKRVRRRAEEKARREECRSWLTSQMRKRPELGRRALNDLSEGEYDWLLIHDREWLEAHAPPPERVDWEERDAELVAELEHVARELRKSVPPIRVSKNQLIERSEHGWVLWKFLERVPMSARRLEDLQESRSEFLERMDGFSPGANSEGEALE